MCQTFCWTAVLFGNEKVIKTRYFDSKEARDHYVLEHKEWKKRGKICANNLEKHILENIEKGVHDD